MPPRGRHRTNLPTRVIAAVAALLVTAGIVVAAGSAAADSDSDSGLLSALTSDESESGSDGGGDGREDGGSSEDADDSGDDGSGDDGSRDDGSRDDGSGDDGSGDDGSGDDDSRSHEDADGSRDDGSGKSEDADGSGDTRSADDGSEDGDRGTGDRDASNRDASNRDKDGEGQDRDDQDRDDADQAVQESRGEGGDEGGQAEAAADPFPGRDEAAPAGEDDYVDIADVEPNGGNLGEGGVFNGGSYSVDCGVSDHNNSDNYMAAPGKRNGAQHVHDYVGNKTTNAFSDEDSLEQGGTSCVNGDQSTFFWPVLRDLNGTGPDVGEDGGSLDGNVGSILEPQSAQLTFRGHGDEPVQAMPTHLMMIMGNAKAGAQDGENVNAKYTCTGQEDRVTAKYPICGQGSQLVRQLDYPSCWDGQNLESANVRDHMAFPDSDGNCENGFVPVPALRITLTYDQPDGRAFSIDSFPNEQHAPNTDHSDYENLASEAQSRRGAECINADEQCVNIPREG